MRFARLFVVFAAMLSLGAATAGSAAATTVEECQAQLLSLRGDTEAAQSSFTSPKDANGLLGKVDEATSKLASGKNADAVQKLVDFQTMLGLLAGAPKPKVDAATAERLGAEAQAAIECVDGIAAV